MTCSMSRLSIVMYFSDALLKRYRAVTVTGNSKELQETGSRVALLDGRIHSKRSIISKYALTTMYSCNTVYMYFSISVFLAGGAWLQLE